MIKRKSRIVQQKLFPAEKTPGACLWRKGLENHLYINCPPQPPPSSVHFFTLPILHLRKNGIKKDLFYSEWMKKERENKETALLTDRQQVLLGSLKNMVSSLTSTESAFLTNTNKFLPLKSILID